MSSAKRPKLDDSANHSVYNEISATELSLNIDSTSNKNFQHFDEPNLSLRKIVGASFEIQTNQMNKLNDLLDELRTNANKYIVVRSFAAKPAINVNFRELSFHFTSPQAFNLWNTCLTAAAVTIGLPENAISTASQFQITVTITSSELNNIVNYLNPLTVRTRFERVEIGENDSENIQLYGQFLDGSSVGIFKLLPQFDYASMERRKRMIDNFGPWINMVRVIMPSEIAYSQQDISYTKGFTDFLVEAASIVEKISIWGHEQSNTQEDKKFPISVIRKILSRKCFFLHIEDETTKITHDQVLELIQYFQSNDSKIFLWIGTEANTREERFGEYIVQQFNEDTINHLLIVHSEIESFISPDEKEEDDQKESPCKLLTHDSVRGIDLQAVDKSLRDMINVSCEHTNNQSREIIDFEKVFAKDESMRIKVNSLRVGSLYEKDTVELSFFFESPNGRSLWTTNRHRTSTGNYMGDYGLSIRLKPSELALLNKHLQIIASRTTFELVIIEEDESEVLHAFAELLEKQVVNEILIRPCMISRNILKRGVEIVDFEPLLNLLGKVHPLRLHYERIKITKAGNSHFSVLLIFAVQAAEVVETILIGRSVNEENTEEDAVPISILKEILRRKCNCLQFGDTINRLSLTEIEELVQFLHHIDKKSSLTFRTEIEFYTQFGEYNVYMTTPDFQFDVEDLLLIEHSQITEDENFLFQ